MAKSTPTQNTQPPVDSARDPLPGTEAGETAATDTAAVGADAIGEGPDVDAPLADAPKRRTVRRQVTAPVLNTLSATTAPETTVIDTEAEALPEVVTLAAPYAFYDDAGVLQSWLQGSVIDDAETIALLVERGAIFEAE